MRLSLVIFLFLSSCSYFERPIKAVVGESEAIALNLKDSDKSAANMPFNFEVVDEVNDGEKIYIKGSVKNEANFDISQVVLRLIGTKRGKTKNEELYLLSDLINGNEGDFTVEMSSSKITNYQLELLWGKDALSYLNRIFKESLTLVNLEDVTVETLQQCEQEQCEITYRINGLIKNDSNSVIPALTLGVGFVEHELIENMDPELIEPNNEREVPIEHLNLKPRKSRAFNLELDAPEDKDLGEMKPFVRILR